ncbi:MAG: ABC transporter ATP-binding protein [Firmicutes bacterium]|nr:ABC transporter ATP-binding protein [Bacillota bacterium]
MADLVLAGITKSLGGKVVIDNLNLEVRSGEMVCLLGSSGSGKTTTLRMIGGFIPVDKGEIAIDGRRVTHLPPDKRPTAMVFQSYALWPNMTVYNNVAYGLRVRRMRRSEIATQVDEVLQLVGLTEHRNKYPAQLSGGQQQRVALARAIVLRPEVLLLDEPLSNLDAQMRVHVREELRDIQRRAGITAVFVTHDQEEALSVSDRVALLRDGRIEQYDVPGNLYKWPATRFAATFIGSMNFFDGTPQEHAVMVAGQVIPCTHGLNLPPRPLQIGVRPEDVLIDPTNRTGVAARVTRVATRGHYCEVVLDTHFGPLRSYIGAAQAAEQQEGDLVHVHFARALGYADDQLQNPVDSADSVALA